MPRLRIRMIQTAMTLFNVQQGMTTRPSDAGRFAVAASFDIFRSALNSRLLRIERIGGGKIDFSNGVPAVTSETR
jgi:hypothetical protein